MAASKVSALSAIGNVDRKTLRELTLARVREAIAAGQLPPGTHLAEIELSEALSVSRGTLREALRHLQQEGLLQADSRGRLTVRVVTPEEVHDIFSVRAALEALAFEEICGRDDRAEIVAELRALLAPLADPAVPLPEKLEADLLFHRALCRLSGNATLYGAWQSVSGLARASITAAGSVNALTNMAHDRHAPIVELLERGDVEAGRVFLRQHMHEAAERILADLAADAD